MRKRGAGSSILMSGRHPRYTSRGLLPRIEWAVGGASEKGIRVENRAASGGRKEGRKKGGKEGRKEERKEERKVTVYPTCRHGQTATANDAAETTPVAASTKPAFCTHQQYHRWLALCPNVFSERLIVRYRWCKLRATAVNAFYSMGTPSCSLHEAQFRRSTIPHPERLTGKNKWRSKCSPLKNRHGLE